MLLRFGIFQQTAEEMACISKSTNVLIVKPEMASSTDIDMLYLFQKDLLPTCSIINREVAMKKRCSWCLASELYTRYHDEEWGVPLHDDGKLFEFLILEGAQAGLSWLTILRRREAYRKAFSGFDPIKVANYNARSMERLMNNEGIIRNRLKIESAVNNAKAFLKVKEAFGSFDAYIWRFVDGKPIKNAWRRLEELPAKTALSEKLSRDLRSRGFKFAGPIIVYAHMQATGMVNDHTVDCFRHKEVARLAKSMTAGNPGKMTD